MQDQTRAWIQIHICVVLWGFTAILGKLISIPALPLVLWRMLMVAAVLFLLPRVWRGLMALTPRLLLAYAFIGVVVALHWLTFYGSVKLANASVAATCMATVPVFLSLIEPLVTGSKFRRRELLLGVLILPGIFLLVGGTPATMNMGIVVGILSAFFVAIFSALNKRLVHRADALSVTAIEMGAGGLFLVLFSSVGLLLEPGPIISAFITDVKSVYSMPGRADIIYMLILAFACTLLPFALSLVAMRHISAYATSLAVNMEPVYAILLAIILLNEQQELNAQFYLGAAIIVILVFSYPMLQRVSDSVNSRKQRSL